MAALPRALGWRLSRLVHGRPADLPGPLEGMVVQRTGRGRRFGFHTPLGNPTWLPAARADHMRPDDPVLGVTVGDRAWALPWWVMKNHHVANLVLESQPIMVVLCEACAGGAAFHAVVDGRVHTFRVEGKYRATHILIDAETGSLWAPFTGEALHGPRKGTWLPRLPLHQCTWREWTALRPSTEVLDGTGEDRAGHGSTCPSPESRVRAHFVLTHLGRDDRLDDLELVLGVQTGGRARAYPLAGRQPWGPVLNDTIGGCEVVILAKPEGWLAGAFERRLDGRLLVFRATEDPTAVEDAETGTRWDLTGRAVSGPLAGRVLPFVPSGIEKWYAWVASHPDTEVHGAAPLPRQGSPPLSP